jgi:hypothetical protein
VILCRFGAVERRIHSCAESIPAQNPARCIIGRPRKTVRRNFEARRIISGRGFPSALIFNSLLHLDRRSLRDELAKHEGVPICEPDAAMAFVPADPIWRRRSMHANAWPVEGNPHDADRVSRTRWQLISSVTTHPAFQDRSVPAEGRHENIGGNFPCSGGHGNLARAWSARKARNKAVAFVNLDQPLRAQQF